jgi:hypothetical protein
LLTFRAHLHFKGHLLIFLKHLKAFRTNFGEVSKQIFAAAVPRDEAKPFASLNHLTVPVSRLTVPKDAE